MVKKLLLIASLLCVAVPSAHADEVMPTCGKTKYNHPVKGISYGMTKKDVRSTLKRNYPSPQHKVSEEGDLLVLEFSAQPTFSRIAFNFKGDRLFQMKLFYSDKFIESLGGEDAAKVSVLKKLVEKFGNIDSHEPLNMGGQEGHKVYWSVHEGASLVLIAIGNFVVLSYECEALSVFMTSQQAKSANFGF